MTKSASTSIPSPVGGLDVKPINTVDNVCHMPAGNREISGDIFVAIATFCPSPNVVDLRFCELFYRTVLATIMCAVNEFVFKIPGSGVVTQIYDVIIAGVSVIVAAVHSIRPRANKRRQNKKVNVSSFTASVLIKINNLAFNSVRSLAKNFTALPLKFNALCVCCHTVNASNITKVGDFIKPLVARNRLPRFVHVATPSNAPIKVHGDQWGRWFSGATLAMSFNYSKGFVC